MPTPSSPPKVTESLRQLAYRRFREALFAGRIKPGDFLSQREVCELLDVPMGPVREALKSLESQNIVTLVPQRGIRVIQVDAGAFKQAIEARKIIEGAAAENFATHAPLELIREIADQTESFRQSYLASSEPADALFAEKSRVDFLLHDAMMGFLNNPLLMETFHRATEHVRIFRLNVAASRRSFDLPAIEEHMAILHALKQRDAQGAKRALHLHLDGALARAIPLASHDLDPARLLAGRKIA